MDGKQRQVDLPPRTKHVGNTSTAPLCSTATANLGRLFFGLHPQVFFLGRTRIYWDCGNEWKLVKSKCCVQVYKDHEYWTKRLKNGQIVTSIFVVQVLRGVRVRAEAEEAAGEADHCDRGGFCSHQKDARRSYEGWVSDLMPHCFLQNQAQSKDFHITPNWRKKRPNRSWESSKLLQI